MIMTAGKLIEILQEMPPNIEVEVNDNRNGCVWDIEGINYFEANSWDEERIIIQVNV